MLKRKDPRLNHKSRKLMTHTDIDSLISEQLRGIRTSMQFMCKGNQQTFLITSAEKYTGKSVITVNLALTLAKQGKSVLLIDANLREPTLYTYFNVPFQKGIANVLQGEATLKESIYESRMGRLDILPSGVSYENPAEVFDIQSFYTILHELEPMYDLILIDTPNIIQHAETRILAKLSDGVVFVIKYGKTKMENALQAKEMLKQADAHLVGAIMNHP